jgi:uncharacterized membrane protein
VRQHEEVDFLGMRYVIPVVVGWPGTIIAVNVGGAVIPTLLSFYLYVRNELWIRGIIAIACVAAVCHFLAQPVPGVGIALPVFVPPLSTAVVALLLSRRYAAPLAYIGGSMARTSSISGRCRGWVRRLPRSAVLELLMGSF